MHKITPFLWFDDNLDEAMTFYSSVFRNVKIVDVSRRGPDGPVMSATFEIEGQRFMGLNAGPQFRFTEAVSFFVSCETQAEVDELWGKLADGGKEGRCGWVMDRFGLWWQVVPTALGRLMRDPDPARSQRVMQAMLGMNKIDVAGLERAYGQAA